MLPSICKVQGLNEILLPKADEVVLQLNPSQLVILGIYSTELNPAGLCSCLWHVFSLCTDIYFFFFLSFLSLQMFIKYIKVSNLFFWSDGCMGLGVFSAAAQLFNAWQE